MNNVKGLQAVKDIWWDTKWRLWQWYAKTPPGSKAANVLVNAYRYASVMQIEAYAKFVAALDKQA